MTVDGKDVLAVWRAAGEAIERARKGQGPTLIECKTYRNYGHFEGDSQKYKTEEERQRHLHELDAIARFKTVLLESGLASEKELQKIEEEAEQAVAKAVEFAEASPYPEEMELLTDVYVSY
jgi:pyruvate dehydrogenase E1 component alpha subunit